jgi:hypothetical protein
LHLLTITCIHSKKIFYIPNKSMIHTCGRRIQE